MKALWNATERALIGPFGIETLLCAQGLSYIFALIGPYGIETPGIHTDTANAYALIGPFGIETTDGRFEQGAN